MGLGVKLVGVADGSGLAVAGVPVSWLRVAVGKVVDVDEDAGEDVAEPLVGSTLAVRVGSGVTLASGVRVASATARPDKGALFKGCADAVGDTAG